MKFLVGKFLKRNESYVSADSIKYKHDFLVLWATAVLTETSVDKIT